MKDFFLKFAALLQLLLFHGWLYCFTKVESFVTPSTNSQRLSTQYRFGVRSFSTTETNNVDRDSLTTPNYNGVFVAKEGGRGATTASQQALEKNLKLGAPPARPSGGHYLTKGGLQVTAHVEPLEFSTEMKTGTSTSAIEELVEKLDEHKGVLLTSSYEFPGRYARWSLGFVDPPLEITGKGSKCTIKALNQRGKILMPAIEEAMKNLKNEGVLAEVHVSKQSHGVAGSSGSGDALENTPSRIDVAVVPPPDVGTFSEEERSRQVSYSDYILSLYF